jgi:hypothetical protein
MPKSTKEGNGVSENNMNFHDISELKADIKNITTFMHGLDKGIGEVKTMLEMIKDVKDMTIENTQSIKSAHKRIDDIEVDKEKDKSLYVSKETYQNVVDRLSRLEKVSWFIGSAVGLSLIGALMKLVIN